MKKLRNFLLIFWIVSGMAIEVSAQKTIYVRPIETDDVLTNPGIGFMTFQRFNGDELNEGIGWTEGFPIEYQEFDGNLENKDHPMTSIAYFRVYWKFVEPEMDNYNWAMLDLALKTAHERQQTLLLRIAPYGTGPDRDVPAWYRAMVGERDEWLPEGREGWRVDAEDPKYAQYFGKFITALGQRYDGHPDLEAVDLSIIGFWGEGRGSAILTQKTREALVDAYTDNFKKTPLIMLLTDEKTNKYGLTQANVGWRVDCIGDLDFWAEEQDGWTHMYRYYPQGIINFGMKDAWKKAPVSLEICGTLKSWKEKQGYNANDVDYIIDETLKWHISSFNAKSSGVPEEWWPQINRWLKKMGYRFVLRSFAYPEFVAPNEKLAFKSWWENNGVAPCYKEFPLAIRLKNEKRTHILVTEADIRTWLPGDNLYDDAVFIPMDMPSGNYDLQIGIIDPVTAVPKIKLAIEGRDTEGWYTVGKLKIKKAEN
ncbi:MAG: DUF4832 domain-containing protein [Bacteroidetes bacterium]|nr:DUF4832 domain-containing protein [Bacteroidota bacterium]